MNENIAINNHNTFSKQILNHPSTMEEAFGEHNSHLINLTSHFLKNKIVNSYIILLIIRLNM